MKKYWVLVVLVLIISALTLSQPVKETVGGLKKPTHPMDQVLKSTNGEFYEVSILAWAKLNEKFMEVDDMKNTLAQLDETYYNTQSTPKFHIEENYKSCEIDSQIKSHKSFQAILQTYRPTAKTPELTPESYYLIEIAQSNADFSLATLEQEVKNIYSVYGTKPEITMTYTAKIKGRITSAAAEEILEKAGKILELTNEEQVASSDFYSLSGHSTKFKSELVLAGKKRNFTLNIRYNLADDCTYVVFGTPDIGGQT